MGHRSYGKGEFIAITAVDGISDINQTGGEMEIRGVTNTQTILNMELDL